MNVREYTEEAYLHFKNHDIENLQNYIETYINDVKSDIVTGTPEFCDFNYIYAKHLFNISNFNVGKDYINAALISFNTGHLVVSFQEILSLWVDLCGNLGEYNQIRKLFDTYNEWNFKESDEVRRRIVYWHIKLNYPNNTYTFTMHDKLKVKFAGSQFVISNYSEAMQDMFILSILNGKRNGTYIELGAAEYSIMNNTYLLETLYSWEGFSVEYGKELVQNFNKNRKNKCIYADATKLDYEYLIKERFDTNRIDYLQVDLDPASVTYEALEKVLKSNVRFSIITFEHDAYWRGSDVKFKARELLESKGYILAVPDIRSTESLYTPFEDWYIDSQIMTDDIQKIINTLVDEKYDGVVNNFFYKS